MNFFKAFGKWKNGYHFRKISHNIVVCNNSECRKKLNVILSGTTLDAQCTLHQNNNDPRLPVKMLNFIMSVVQKDNSITRQTTNI